MLFKKIKLKDLNWFQKEVKIITKQKKKELIKNIKDGESDLVLDVAFFDEKYWIMDGHHRHMVLLEIKGEEYEVPCNIHEDVTNEKEGWEKLVALNESKARFIWDELGVELSLYGIEGTHKEDLALYDVPDLEDDKGEAPVGVAKKVISETGDLYCLKSDRITHYVRCGDSTVAKNLEELMQGKKANMMFTDPPYNVDYEGTAGKIENDKFINSELFYDFLCDFFTSVSGLIKGDVYCCMTSSELSTLQRAFSDSGGHWSTFIIWVKNKFTLGRSNYHRQYEPILYGWFEGSSHFWFGSRKLGDIYKDEVKFGEDGRSMLYSDELNTDIWEFDKPSANKEHPTMKPVPLCERSIKNSSPIGGIVIDPFTGSGSTLIACENLKRNFYGQEFDPKYVDVIIRRYIGHMKLVGKEFSITKNGEEIKIEEFITE